MKQVQNVGICPTSDMLQLYIAEYGTFRTDRNWQRTEELCNHYWRQKCGKRQQINTWERRIGRLEKVRRNKEKTGKQVWKK